MSDSRNARAVRDQKALALKATRPDLMVWAITGDGRAAAFEGWALAGFYAILAALVWFE